MTTLSEGQVLDGKYALIRMVHSGSAATVFEAMRLKSSDKLAVKVAVGSESSDILAESFAREVDSLQRLRHRGVVIHSHRKAATGKQSE